MTIERERYDGPISFLCDATRCTEVCETHCEDFNGALAKMKSRGWRVSKKGDEWVHYCPEHPRL